MEPPEGEKMDEDFVVVGYPFTMVGGQSRQVCVPRSAILEAAQIRLARPWEYKTLAQTYRQSARGGSFVEVGAHLGSDTVLACDFFKTCYAFEPAAANRALLLRTVELNGIGNVRVIPAAVSDRTGKAWFYTQDGVSATHSLAANDPDMEPREEVELVTLDTAFPPSVRDVTYLHIDAEGHDIKVLMGGRQFIARQENRPVIRMEFQPRTLALHGSSMADLAAIIHEFQYNIFFRAENYMVPLNQRILAEMFDLWQGTKGWIDIYLSPW
jgi:FkbM family methyltransferase